MTAPAALPRTNTLALVGFIAAFVVPVAGLVLGILARNQLARPGNVETGTGLARWAMILGALGSAATLLLVILWFSVFFTVIGGHTA